MFANRRKRHSSVIVIAALTGLLLTAASSSATSTARFKGLTILVVGTCSEQVDPLAAAIAARPGVTGVTTFNTSYGTPTTATLAGQNLVVATGDSCGPSGSPGGYNDATAWGNRLAAYLDAGGALLQAAYDNWNSPNTYPRGRFASHGYAPFVPGHNDNVATTLGAVLHPSSPIVKGLGTFPNSTNTTDALAPGATLLAKWADGRNAIAVKGHVVSTTAGAYDSDTLPDLAILAVNTGNYVGTPDTKIGKVTINQATGSAKFKFAAVPSARKFECALNQGHAISSFTPCHSGKTYQHLAPGRYTFAVRAVGSMSPDQTPATKKFVIK